MYYDGSINENRNYQIFLYFQDSPRIQDVGPSKVISAKMYEPTKLSCNATGNPPPQYQWLQKLPTQEVLIRSYEKDFVIKNVTYEYQGEWVCKAVNVINGHKRAVQSNPIKLEVSGRPQVMRYHSKKSVMVSIGDEAVLEVPFCANPVSNQSWHLGDDSDPKSGNNIILTAGTGTGRFHAESVKSFQSNSNQKRDNCYISTLRIKGAHPSDSRTYKLLLTNAHGVDHHYIKLAVKGKKVIHKYTHKNTTELMVMFIFQHSSFYLMISNKYNIARHN